MQISKDCPECGEYAAHETIEELEKRSNGFDVDETKFKCRECGAYHDHEELKE